MGALSRAGDRAVFDSVDKAVGQEFGVNAQVTVPAQQLQHLIRHRADARLHGRAVGDPLYDMLGVLRSTFRPGRAGSSTNG
jgi:hypothetical protein